MYRIVVDPEALASLAAKLRETASDLNAMRFADMAETTLAETEIRQKSRMLSLIDQAERQRWNLVTQLQEMARFLERKAKLFAEADRQGVRWIKRIAINLSETHDEGYEKRERQWWQQGRKLLWPEEYQNWLESGYWFKYRELPGQLFIDGPELDDIIQGKGLGDCYLIAAMGAVAQRDPDIIRQMIRDNGDGTYTVTFYELDENGDPIRPVEVIVNGKLPTKDGKEPRFAKSADEGELWPAIIEKAYVKWKGGEGDYEDIKEGIAPLAMAELTGYSARGVFLSQYTEHPDQVLSMIQDAITQGHPIVAGGASQPVPDLGIVDYHSYVVAGVTGDGKIVLRNPWGPESPRVELTPEEFCKYYGYIGISGA